MMNCFVTFLILINPMSKTKRTTTRQISVPHSRFSLIYWNYVVIALAIAVFIFTCLKLDLTQDDAYITFRYAANFLSGHGLVFNTGERVEGYTNFLWVMLMALFKGVFGIEYLTFSKVAGVITGSAIFFLLYFLLKHHFEKVPIPLHISLVVVLLSNLSIAYWSIAGLETSAFTCMVLAAVIAEYWRPQLSPALLIIASLLRPEGVIVFGVILFNRLIVTRRIPWQVHPFLCYPIASVCCFQTYVLWFALSQSVLCEEWSGIRIRPERIGISLVFCTYHRSLWNHFCCSTDSNTKALV